VSRDPKLTNQVLDSWPASFRLLVADDVMSMEPAELLRTKARAWEMARRNRRSAEGPEICTYHGAKGLTRTLVVVVRSDVLGRDLADPFPGVAPSDEERRSEAYRLAYVALTRASEVYVELSLGPANLLHHGGLQGWEYIETKRI